MSIIEADLITMTSVGSQAGTTPAQWADTVERVDTRMTLSASQKTHDNKSTVRILARKPVVVDDAGNPVAGGTMYAEVKFTLPHGATSQDRANLLESVKSAVLNAEIISSVTNAVPVSQV